VPLVLFNVADFRVADDTTGATGCHIRAFAIPVKRGQRDAALDSKQTQATRQGLVPRMLFSGRAERIEETGLH